MKSFDCWFDENIDYLCTTKDSAKEAYEAGQHSRQDEVDSLRNQLNTEKSLRSMSEHLNSTKQIEIDELKKRINDALNVIYKEKSAVECGKYEGVDADLIIGIGYEVHEILKGETNE